jgi:predicted transposase/invertase (TIGR01784 family)
MAICQYASVSGLAVRSIANACLRDSSDEEIAHVDTVTPQRVRNEIGKRGYRLDVEFTTLKNEIVICEVQLRRFKYFFERVLLYTQAIDAIIPQRGEALTSVTENVPRVISINILDYPIKQRPPYFHEVGTFCYLNEPREPLSEKLAMHLLQLPVFEKIKHDYENPLHLWMLAFVLSHKQKKPLNEVVKMNDMLRKFYNIDLGFAQFVDRYGLIASDPQTHKEYLLWLHDLKTQAQEIESLKAEVKAEVEAKVQMKTAMGILKNLSRDGDLSSAIELLVSIDIPEDIIKAAKARFEAESSTGRQKG